MLASDWLRTRTHFPADGIQLEATYKSGNGTSSIYKIAFDPVLAPSLGGPIQRGSLNLWADAPVGFPNPARVMINEVEWLFAPIVISNTEVGVAARKAETGDHCFIEVFACKHLASALALKVGDRVDITLHNGEHLGLAA